MSITRRRGDAERRRGLVVLGALAAVVGVVLPLQTYLGNSSIFPFSFARLLPELLAIFAIFTAGLLLIGYLGEKFSAFVLGRLRNREAQTGGSRSCATADGLDSVPSGAWGGRPFFLAFLTAALVCVYLESGLLSLGLPELNGGPVAELANRTRALVDAGVWVVVIAGFLIFARKLAPWLHWIALAVLVLSLACLVDVAARSSSAPYREGVNPARSSVDAGPCPRQEVDVAARSGSAPYREGTNASMRPLAYEPQPTVVANVKYSPTRNILVFVLDSMPGRASVDVLAADESLRAKFAGFTAYRENVGMHECTKRGVPGLVTGHHYDPAEMSEADYPMTMYGTNSFIRTAEAAGWNVAFSPDLLPYGATNLPVERRVARQEEKRSRDNLAFLRQSTEVPFLSLFDTVAFRLSPFVFKGPILYSRIRHAVKGRHSAAGFWGEGTMYPQLAARPVNGDGRPFLGFFHSWGAHPPWEADFRTTVTEKFAALARLMDAYRASGLYDKSLIVVTSDHGLDQAPSPKGYPSSASALLLVKPEGAAAPFAVSDAQTSHAKIAPLVKAALAGRLKASDCGEILRCGVPLYRTEVREGGRESFKDWPQ